MHRPSLTFMTNSELCRFRVAPVSAFSRHGGKAHRHLRTMLCQHQRCRRRSVHIKTKDGCPVKRKRAGGRGESRAQSGRMIANRRRDTRQMARLGHLATLGPAISTSWLDCEVTATIHPNRPKFRKTGQYLPQGSRVPHPRRARRSMEFFAGKQHQIGSRRKEHGGNMGDVDEHVTLQRAPLSSLVSSTLLLVQGEFYSSSFNLTAGFLVLNTEKNPPQENTYATITPHPVSHSGVYRPIPNLS